MKRPLYTLIIFACLLVASPALLHPADFFGDALKKGLPQLPGLGAGSTGQTAGTGLDDSTIASGLKDALSVGTKNAVGLVSKLNGYFGNEAIKILLPDKIQKMADMAGKLGFQKQENPIRRQYGRHRLF